MFDLVKQIWCSVCHEPLWRTYDGIVIRIAFTCRCERKEDRR